MFCVGLTGNIASGKTMALQIFKKMGIEVIIADVVARALTQPGEPALMAICRHFGPSILNKNNELDREKLRALIVEQSKERLWLENLLHPLIRQQIIQQVKTCVSPYCVIEIPLLINRSDYPYLNHVLLILASHALQIERVMQRDSCSKKQAEAILALQPSEQQRRSIADEIIFNQGSLTQLTQAIEKLHQFYLSLVNT